MNRTLLAFVAVGATWLHAADATSTWTVDQKEAFLLKAKLGKQKGVSKGITGTVRVTLTDGNVTHDASVQRVHEYQHIYQTAAGTEIDFKDTWEFNMAAWKLARLLGIDDMMPPYVQRVYEGQAASFSWWVDDVLMDEGQRLNQKVEAPDHEAWAKEVNVMRVFDQLIYNTDRNVTNMMFDKQWHLWMIDHSRSFRTHPTLMNAKLLTQCDRNLLAKMKDLNEATMKKEMGKYVTGPEIKGLLARRDLIVKFFEDQGEKGLFDRPSRK